MANGKLNAFKRIISNKIVRTLASLAIAGGITFASKKLNSYETGTFGEQSIHPLLVEKLEEYAQIPDDIYFDKNEIQKGTINEDSPEDTYIRAFNHFNPGLPGFSSAIEWVLSPGLQSKYPYGDHSWNRTVEDFEGGQIGENFGFNFHLVADQTSMAHVHQDIHPIYDSYESWTNKHKGEIMGSVQPSQTPEFDTLEELMEDLGDFTRKNFPSDDAWGNSLKGMYKSEQGNKQYWVKDVDGKEIRILRRSFFLNFKDDNCFRDQWSILGTKAVEYGASAIKLLEKDQPNCIPKNYQDCFNDDLWWFNSCGDPGTVVQYCDNGCDNGECVNEPTCTNYDYKDCDGSEVWWFDSCDNLQEYVETCDYGCSDGVCEGQSCYSHDSKICSGGDVHWEDSCGNLEEVIEYCDNGCSDGECNGSVCSDECDYSGQKECVGNDWKECEYVGDCFEWGKLNSCGDDETCENGKCVSNNQWIDQGDGTIKDTITNSIWEKSPSSQSVNWFEAGNYCNNLNLGNSQWSLPPHDELMMLHTDKKVNGCYWDPIFKGTCDSYWTSTPGNNMWETTYYYVLFNEEKWISSVSWTNPSQDYLYVRCIKK